MGRMHVSGAPGGNASQTDPEAELWQGVYAGGGYPANTVPSAVVLRVIRRHRKLGANGGDALDLGCGQGFDLKFLAEHGYRVTGIDYVEKAVKEARARVAAAGQPDAALVADLRTLGLGTWPLRNRQFDVVVAIDVLNLLGKDADRVLSCLPGLVAPGGIVGINTPNINHPSPNEGGRRWFTLEELEAGFPGWELIEKMVTTFPDGEKWGGIILRRPSR